jgi:peptidoglycan/xylan/chitin deacetylase (PgdA/CDA1 family)
LQQTQQLVKDKTGIVLKAFGAPFNVTNTDTEKALEEFPEIDIWFFGSNKTKESKKLILKRVINLEQPTMSPNSAGLIRDYEYKGKFEPYLVLQGHPNGWDDRKFNEFAKSVAYLKGKGCKFMTVSEYYEQQKK